MPETQTVQFFFGGEPMFDAKPSKPRQKPPPSDPYTEPLYRPMEAVKESAQMRLIREKGDDHFYGAWKGGSAKAGGGPAESPEGRAITGGDRWANHDSLISEMEGKYPGSQWSDLKKLDIHTASLAADQIDVVVDRFGGIPNFKGVRVPEHNKPGVVAEVKRVDKAVPGSAVYLYPGYWKGDGLAKMYAGSKNPKDFTSNGLGSKEAMGRAIITHELGHQYMGLNLHSRLGADRNAAVRKELEPWFHGTFLPNISKAHVSRYARRNPHEAWAELFSAATGAGQSSSHFVPELKGILDKYYPAKVAESASLLSELESAGKRDINLHEAKAISDPALEPHCGWALEHPEIGYEAPVKESAQIRILREKGKDDHFYGAWAGGKASAGGGPDKNSDGKPDAEKSDGGAKTFDSLAEGRAWAEERFSGPDKWGQAQWDAAREYVGTTKGSASYAQINGWARGERPPYLKPKAIAALDRLTARDTVPETVVARRAVGFDAFGGKGALPGLKGAVVSDGGFLSTNLGPSGAIGMNRKPVTMNITVPKGSHGAYIGWKGISKYRDKEAELLLPRNTNLRIVDVRQVGNRWVVDATVE